MFVSTKIHQQLHDEWITERVKRETLSDANRVLTTQLAFLCARVNQLETERALLIRQVTGVQIPVPTFTASTPKTAGDFADAMVSSLFEDMGDEAAKQSGVGWDEDGHVKYAGSRKES